MASRIVDFPLKLLLVPAGSRSVVRDRFSVPSLQEYPLYFKSTDRQKYVAAVQMLHDTLIHFVQSRGKKSETSNDLLELADMLLVRELFSGS